jgi:Zn-dependent protease with chaperone function
MLRRFAAQKWGHIDGVRPTGKKQSSLGLIVVRQSTTNCKRVRENLNPGPLPMIRPSKVLRIYYLTTFLIGLGLTVPLAHYVRIDEVGARGAALLILSWNILFVMILPLILDWAEGRYFKARFLALEEVAKDNPELAEMLRMQCEKLSLPNLKLAVIDNHDSELFSYGLWRNNPRLIVSNEVLTKHSMQREIAPSIEAELTRFASQDHTLIFLMFAAFQLMAQNLLLLAYSTYHFGF